MFDSVRYWWTISSALIKLDRVVRGKLSLTALPDTVQSNVRVKLWGEGNYLIRVVGMAGRDLGEWFWSEILCLGVVFRSIGPTTLVSIVIHSCGMNSGPNRQAIVENKASLIYER